MSAKRNRRASGQIDLRAVLDAPIKVKRDDDVSSLHPHEATLRQHVRNALIDGSVPSMKFLMDEAEKHNLIAPTPPPLEGGVFVVPKELPEEDQRAIFDVEPDPGEREPMGRIARIVSDFCKKRRSASDGK